MRVLYILYPEREDEPRVILSKDLRGDQVRGPRHEIARTHRRTLTALRPGTGHFERGGSAYAHRSAGAKDTAASAYRRVNLTMPLRHCLESSAEQARLTGVGFVIYFHLVQTTVEAEGPRSWQRGPSITYLLYEIIFYTRFRFLCTVLR